MALTYTQCTQIAQNEAYKQQMQAAVLKYALGVVASASPAAPSLALAVAVVQAAASGAMSVYTNRFLYQALLASDATLSPGTVGGTLSPAPLDSAFDTAVANQWAAQVTVGP
jgi:hypothetical protein